MAPSILAASSAALSAPPLPIACVPTGTPAGICTMDSRESMPLRACDCTGTPSTGNTVFAATMPGRCAAPPAPLRLLRIAEQEIGRAVRGHDARLERHTELLERGRGVLQCVPVGR